MTYPDRAARLRWAPLPVALVGRPGDDRTFVRAGGVGVCFAPEADLAVGVAVIAIGVDALRHVRVPRQIPLAALPVLLGLHQVTEAFVWWGLQEHAPDSVERVALWTYLLFALAVLPILVPTAVLIVERSTPRRRVMGVAVGLGVMVATALTTAMLRGPIEAAIDGRHVAYSVDDVRSGGLITGLYVIATCGALLASSDRDLEILGAASLLAVPVLAWLTLGGLVSLWCFWAAIVSAVIALHLRGEPGRALSSRPA